MKVHRVVTMLGATQESGRLAKDMYELNDKIYRSKSTNKEIPISHMDFQHAIRTLVKFIEEEEKVMIGANDIALTKDEVIKAQEKIINGLRSQVETYQEKLEAKPKDYTLEELRKEKDEALDEGVSLSNQLEGLKEQLEEKDKEHEDYTSHLKHRVEFLQSKVAHWHKKFIEANATKGHRYTFCEIPNDEHGRSFVFNLRKYLNTESYDIRVRGQHVKPELRGTGVSSFGQSIEQSSHLRIYIDKK